MRCSDFHHRLDALLDDRQNPAADPLLRSHAANCPACRRLLNDNAALLGSLARITTPNLNRAFSQRAVVKAAAVTSLPSASRRPARRILQAAGASLASAAAMLMAISVIWYAHRREPTFAGGVAPPMQVGPRSGGLPNIAIAISPFSNQSSKKQAAPRPAPTVTIADVLIESPHLPSRLHTYRGALDDLAIALPAASQRLDEFEQLAPAIRPLRASLALIWDTLCRTIPTTHNGSPVPPRESTGFFSFQALGLT